MWSKFNIQIITIPTSNVKRIHQTMKDTGIEHYNINTFEPAKKRKNNGKKDLSLLDIMSHNHTDCTARNITKNHINIIKSAFKNRMENILVMEDDVTFRLNIDNKVNRVIEWLDTKKGWDIIYFGYCTWPVPFSILQSRDIVWLPSALLGHCYLLSRRGMMKVLRTYRRKSNYHIEKVLLESDLNMYGIYPSIAFQIEPPSLYTRAMDMMHVNINHNTLFITLEHISVILPVLIIIIIILYIYASSKKSYQSSSAFLRCLASPNV